MSNAIIYHGLNEEYQWDSPYRKLMCAVIEQAVLQAQGLELDADGKPTKLREMSLQAAAIEYLMSDGFNLDCEGLELPCQADVFIERTRDRVKEVIEHHDYQLSTFNIKTQVIFTPKKSRKFGGQYAIDKFGKNSKSLFAIVKAAQVACAESNSQVK